MKPLQSGTAADLLNQLPGTLSGKGENQWSPVRELPAPDEIFLYQGQTFAVNRNGSVVPLINRVPGGLRHLVAAHRTEIVLLSQPLAAVRAIDSELLPGADDG